MISSKAVTCLAVNDACCLMTGCHNKNSPKWATKKLFAMVALSLSIGTASKLNSIRPNKRCS